MYFPNINLLRAFAALLVLVYHVIELAPWPDFPASGVGLMFRAGWVGVDLFFVISGFVIGLSAIRLYREGASDYRRTFMRRRLARIVPLYVFTCAAFLLMVDSPVFTLPWRKLALQLGSHLLFLHNLHPSLHGAINGPNWSVAAEMQFYVLVIVAVPLLSRMDLRWLVAGGVLVAWTSGRSRSSPRATRAIRMSHSSMRRRFRPCSTRSRSASRSRGSTSTER